MSAPLPKVFIGSSSEDLPVVDEIVEGLSDLAVLEPWRGSFTPGSTTIDDLITHSRTADAAVFVFGSTDWTESRGAGSASPRDNVVYEAGLFAGELGMDRTFIVAARGVRLPSDLAGVTLVTYDPDDSGSRQAQPALATIRRRLRELGPRDSFLGAWWQRRLSPDDQLERTVLSLVEITRDDDGAIALSGIAWDRAGVRLARFWSIDVCRLTSVEGLLYQWEGDWPGVPGQPDLFGVGRMTRASPRSAIRGWFTTTERSSTRGTGFFKVMYVRASPEDAAVVHDGTTEERRALVAQQLDSEVPPFNP